MPDLADSIRDLATRLEGVVFAPGEAGFPEEAAGFNLATLHEPALVVGPASEADVQAAVRFAEEHGMAVRMQCTGHGSHATVRDGILLSTSRLDTLRIDEIGRAHV
jgi:FAD/FMN-containing dehydrogenase